MTHLDHLKERMSIPFPGNLSGLLDRSAKRYAHRPGIAASDQILSFREYHDLVCKMVNGLRNVGLAKGDRIVFSSTDNLYHAIISLAVFRMGAVLVPVNQRIGHHELAHIFIDTEAGCMISDSPVVLRALKASESYERIKTPFFITLNKRIPYAAFIEDLDTSIPDQEFEQVHPNTTAMIVYTAAMDGYALGAQLTHGSLFYDAVSFADASINEETGKKEVIASVLPLFHSYGFTNGLLVPLAGGVTCLLLETFMGRMKIVSLLEKFNATQLISVPSVFFSLMKPLAEKPELCSRFTNLTSGGIRMPRNLFLAYQEKLGLDIMEGYGLTETSPVVTWSRIDRPPGSGDVGRPLSCCDVKIADENSVELPWGQTGEILVKGLNVFSGYLNQPKRTQKAFVNGWFKTGDMGYLDEDQYLTVTGLKKEMFNVLGLKVYPKEVERILSYHWGIEAVRIWSEWDTNHGDILTGEIKLNGHSLGKKDIFNWCKKNISPYKIPRKLKLTHSLKGE